MAHWLGIGLLLLAGFYGWRMAWYARGWTRLLGRNAGWLPGALPTVSVVIAARNEAERIERCLYSIMANAYPADRLEIVVVDDCSDDGTAELVSRIAAGQSESQDAPPVRLLRAEDNRTREAAHKKAAVDLGVRAARGEIILLTDADVEAPRSWIRTMVAHLDPAADMVAGPVAYHPVRSTFDGLQALEFVGWVAIGAGSIGAGRPEICNGANLGVRRPAFEDAGGLDTAGTTSGDDISLLHAIEARNPGSVRFCPSPEALVRTAPNPSLSAFLTQRARWASKGTSYPRRSLVASVFVMVFFDTFLFLATPAVFLAPILGPYVLAGWVIKGWSTHRLVAPVCRHLGVGRLLRYFWGVLFLQPLYLAYAGFIGLSKGYVWKSRRIRR